MKHLKTIKPATNKDYYYALRSYIPFELRQKLEQHCHQCNETKSNIIRRLLTDYLN